MPKKDNPKKRCPWVNLSHDAYVAYHDVEWGEPVHDDRLLFEMLILEGAQAGLSWETVLKKRANYQRLFAQFDPVKVARFTPKKIESLMQDPGIIRNRLKIESTVSNAKAFLKVQKEYGSFAKYLWQFVDNKPINHCFTGTKDYPSKTPLSDKISKDLKKRGFRFVGSTIIYAYMQAVGLVNDHSVDCFKRKNIVKADDFSGRRQASESPGVHKKCMTGVSARSQQPRKLICEDYKKSWSVYMVKTANGSLYTGVATDVKRRFNEHQTQGNKCAKYLRGKGPLELVYQETIGNKSDAHKREHEIKQFTKTQKLALISL